MDGRNIPFDDNGLTMLPSLQLSMHSDSMSCTIGWCRIISESAERLSTALHRHSVCELHCVLSGRLTFRFGEDVSVPAGSFILIPPNVPHSILCEDGQTAKLVLGFRIRATDPAVGTVLGCGAPRCAKASPAMEGIIGALASKAQCAELMQAQSVRYIVHSLIFEAVDLLSCVQAPKGFPGKGDPGQRRQAILDFVEGNALNQITAADVARHMGFEARQANRICQREFGCSISRLLVSVRLRRIRELLTETEFSLVDVAEIAGFSSVYAFIRHFKLHMGVSPGRYRRMHAGETERSPK